MVRQKYPPYVFFVCKGLSNDDVGVAGGTASREIRPGTGLKTDDFVQRKAGGATVERLLRVVFFVGARGMRWAGQQGCGILFHLA